MNGYRVDEPSVIHPAFLLLHPSGGHCGAAPGGAPAQLDSIEAEPGEYTEAGEQPQAELVITGLLLDGAQAGGEEGAAEGAQQAAGTDAGGGVVTGGHRVQTVLVVEITGQGAGQADKAAEGHAVEKHKPPAVPVTQGFQVVGQGFWLGALRSIFGNQIG